MVSAESEGGRVAYIELVADVITMGLYGVMAHLKLTGNLRGAQSLANEVKHLLLARA